MSLDLVVMILFSLIHEVRYWLIPAPCFATRRFFPAFVAMLLIKFGASSQRMAAMEMSTYSARDAAPRIHQEPQQIDRSRDDALRQQVREPMCWD
jgi:hypothetical protein